MKLVPRIKWTNVAGIGPAAWDQDNKSPTMHTPIEHEEHEHRIVHRTHANEQEKKQQKSTNLPPKPSRTD